jgi:hypothetical protein
MVLKLLLDESCVGALVESSLAISSVSSGRGSSDRGVKYDVKEGKARVWR